MPKRFTDTEKYKKKFIRGLQGAYKLLWDYLYHDCDHAGIWYVDFEIAQLYLGQDMPVNEQDALKYFNNGETRIIVIDGGKKWFIPSFIRFQYGVLNPENKPHRSVIRILEDSGLDKGLIRGLEAPKDKDKEKDKEGESEGKHKKFVPPTLEEVTTYCEQQKNGINPKQWMNHYTAKNWMIGKNKMADWKAAVRTWEENKKKGDRLADSYRPL